MSSRRHRLVPVLAIVSSTLALLSVRCVGSDPTGSAAPPIGQNDPDGGNAGKDTGTGPNPQDGSTTDGSSSNPLVVLDNALTVSVGRTHTCALLADESVACWGSNDSGQLGVLPGVTSSSPLPIRVDLEGKKAKVVAAGAKHTCAITTDDKVYCWGNNEKGQLARPTFTAANSVGAVDLGASITKPGLLAAGGAHTCVGQYEGLFLGQPGEETYSTYCWGDNGARQLATEVNNGLPVVVPTRTVYTPANPAYPHFLLSLGEDFTCAGAHVSPNGSSIFRTAQCWGNNVDEQVAGSTQVVNTATTAPLKPGGGLFAQVLRFATGKAHACMHVDDVPNGKKVFCWGKNTKGQTGDTTTGTRLPTLVPVPFDAAAVTSLAAGGEETCVVSDGKVKCAGSNDQGQLGRGSVDTGTNATFEDVQNTVGATSVSVGGSHACAIIAAGAKKTIKCWGANTLGQLGNGSKDGTPRTTPVDVMTTAP